MQTLSTAWAHPIKRIYLIWGVIMLIGFTIPIYIHWVPLTIIGLILQIQFKPIVNLRAQLLHAIWAVWLVGAMVLNYVIMMGMLPSQLYPPHWAIWWLAALAIPQIITGYMMKDKLQTFVGVKWLVLAIIFWTPTMYFTEIFYVVALVTGLPYLYIAFRK